MNGMQIHKEVSFKAVLGRALSGNLAEDFDAAVLDPGKAKHLVVDLWRITGVSSFGVREWVRAARSAAEKARIWFVGASPRMTDQFNMISGFDGGGTLLSFYGNYLCPHCDNETPALFDTQLDAEAFLADEAPARQCRICGHVAALDDIPEALFEYASSHPVTGVDPDVEAFLQSPQAWFEVAPGQRYAFRRVSGTKDGSLGIHGIIDVSFSVDSIASELGPEVAFVLPHIQHIDAPSGVARWTDVMSRLRRNRKVKLVAIPPVFLQRAMESPGMIAGLEIASAAYPTRCEACQQKALLHVDSRNPLDASSLARIKCRGCNSGPLVSRSDFSDIAEMQQFLMKSRTSSAPPEPGQRRQAAAERSEAGLPPFLAQSTPSRYEMLTKIGEGGMADVYLVRQHGAVGFRRLVVVKVIRPEFLNDDRFVRMFIDEARLAARIDHPNIIRVHDLGRGNGAFFMVMDFLHGRSISEALAQTAKQNVQWPPGLVASIVADLCSGLARAHVPDASGKALVHRDVTPANVFLRFDGIVKLIDFGLAGYHHLSKDANRAGQVVGNFSYLAPEALNNQDATPQLDIWGAGIILAALLTGKHPFRRNTPEETIIAMLRQPPNLQGVPKSLLPIVEKSLQKDPTQRYSSAALMEQHLREAMFEFKRDRKSGQGLLRWLGKKSADEAEPQITLEVMMRRLFSHQIRIENEFMRKSGSPHLVDALLDAQPRDVARLLRTLKGEVAGAASAEMLRSASSASSSVDEILEVS